MIDDLWTIPAPLVEKAKAMGIQPSIHKHDFVFQYILLYWKGDLERTVHAYYNDGNNNVALIHRWMDDYRKSLKIVQERTQSRATDWLPKRLLDFAAGYGRLARHLPLYFPDSRILTCDIHQAAVTFNSEILMLESCLSTLEPEDLQLPQQDLIVCLSFFTHIPKRTFTQWLKQLVSFLAPRGILIFTTHGYVSHVSGGVRDIEIDNEGFGFKPKSEQRDLDVLYYGSTVSYPSYVLRAMSECSNVRLIRFQEGLWWQMQDVYMFAKT